MFLKNENGFALPLVLILVIVLTLLGFTMLMFSMGETTQVFRDENKMKAHYIARSGAHVVASYIVENPENAIDLINSSESDPSIIGEGEFQVLVYGNPADEMYVQSTGTVNNVNQSVVVTVKNVGIDFPAYAKDYMTFVAQGNNAAAIFGGDLVYGNADGKYFSDIIIKEGISINELIDLKEVIPPCQDLDLDYFYGPCPLYPGTIINSSEEINVSSYYERIQLNGGLLHIGSNNPTGENILLKVDEFDLRGNSNMKINLNNNVVAIVADKFEFNSSREIYVEGDGYLLIYVNDLFEGRSDFIVSEESNVNVYVIGEGTFRLAGTPNFTGAVYAPEADVELSGNSTLFGWIIANTIDGRGGVDINYVPIEILGTSMNINILRLEKWRYETN